MRGPEFVEPGRATVEDPSPRRPGRSRRRNLIIGLPVALGVVAGVLAGVALGAGRGPATDDATARVRESVGRTAAGGTSRVALRFTVDAGGAPGASVAGEGVLDLHNGRASLSLDLPVGSVDGVVSGGTVFVEVPGLPSQRKWVKLDLAELVPDRGSKLGALGRMVSADPARALADVVQSAADMQAVGVETVRGVSTTHSRGTFRLRVENAAVEAVAGQVLPLDAWVDGDGRLRKLVVRSDPDRPGPVPSSSLELELFDFGVPVEIAPPAPNQVLADLTGPAKALGGLFGGAS